MKKLHAIAMNVFRVRTEYYSILDKTDALDAKAKE